MATRTLHILLRYALHAYDVRGSGTWYVWERRGVLSYYMEFTFELGALLVELGHHIHMLLWSNIFLSMASLVICMHLRYLVHEIQRRVKKHRNYLWVLHHMEQRYNTSCKCKFMNCSCYFYSYFTEVIFEILKYIYKKCLGNNQNGEIELHYNNGPPYTLMSKPYSSWSSVMFTHWPM